VQNPSTDETLQLQLPGKTSSAANRKKMRSECGIINSCPAR
jgi:hypothetical protein